MLTSVVDPDPYWIRNQAVCGSGHYEINSPFRDLTDQNAFLVPLISGSGSKSQFNWIHNPAANLNLVDFVDSDLGVLVVLGGEKLGEHGRGGGRGPRLLEASLNTETDI